MKKITFGLIIMAFLSCKKDKTNSGQTPPAITDLPQKIKITGSNPVVTTPFTVVYAVKYDTAVGRISVYEDDSATSTPYDRLVYEYQYSNGYLSSFKEITYSSGTLAGQTAHTISRNANNQVQQIVQTTSSGSSNSYTYYYFTYKTLTDTLVITENSGYGYGIYTYNSNNKLLQVADSSSGIVQARSIFQYTAAGALTKIKGRYYTGSSIIDITSDFTYGSLPSALNDKFCKILLGKDYYLQSLLKRYYFLTGYVNDRIAYSATEPNYFTGFTQTGKDIFSGAQVSSDNVSRTIELDANSRLKKITSIATGSSINGTQIIEFTY